MTQENQGVEIHPLLEKEISFIRDWQEWKELWKATKQADLLHSLLHFGFNVYIDSDEAASERVCLYLDIADRNFRSFRRDDDRDIYPYSAFGREAGTIEALRKILSQKAFQSLCQNFFKNTSSEDRLPSWVRIATQPQVLEKLFWFFRLDEDGYIFNFRNPDDHNKVIVKEFARHLCKFAWDCEKINRWYGRYGREAINEETKETLRKARPSMITLLSGLEELDVLYNPEYELDEKCMEQLKNIVMACERWLPSATSWGGEKRKPRTIEEACFGNSQAARVLLILQVKQTEQKRFDAIREAEARFREAENKLKDLKK